MKKTLIILTLLFISCGYEQSEKDKHPHLPLFPDIINSKFEIVKFPYKSYKYLGIVNEKLYTTCVINYVETYGVKKHVVIYDNNLSILNKIPVEGVTNVFENGDFYLVNKQGIEKYIYPNFESVIIKKHPLSYSSVYTDRHEEFVSLKKSDSTLNLHDYVINILDEKLDSINKIKQPCWTKLRNYTRSYTVLKFDNEEFWFDDKYMNFQSFKNCGESKLSYESIDKPKLKIFDYAKLGNKGNGNHFVFSFYQYGIEYFNLIKKQDTLKFKFNSRYLNGRSIEEYRGFNSNQVILKTEWENKMYLIK